MTDIKLQTLAEANSQGTATIESLDIHVKGVVEIATAFLQHNRIEAEKLPDFLRGISKELGRIISGTQEPVDLRSIEVPLAALPAASPAAEPAAPAESKEEIQVDRYAHLPRDPVVPIKQSVTDKAIICLFDGKPMKMLKRYIRAHFNMEAEDYRRFWNLPDDYPMVAPGYAKEKQLVALSQGLGTAKVTKVPRVERGLPEKVAA